MTGRPFGDRALRFAIPSGADRRAILAALRSLPGVGDAVLAEAIGCVVLERDTPLADAALAGALAAKSVHAKSPPRLHEIAVAYDGEDLGDVARAIGQRVEDVIALHCSATYEVAMLGFLPGFGYLVGLPDALVLPRRAPRPRVPPGSVAIAAHYAGVYPLASPGGWHLLGRAIDFRPFDTIHGAALAVGDRVRFQPVVRDSDVDASASAPHEPYAPRTPTGPSLEITRLAGLALLVDHGRPGRMSEGIPPGGALVRSAHARANAFAGNPPAACAIELTGSLEVTARGGELALATEEGPVVLEDGATHAVTSGRAARVTYLALRGGIDAPIVLGSRGVLLVAGIGRPLRRGDRFAPGDAAPATPSPPGRQKDEAPDIEVIAGPDEVPGAELTRIARASFHVATSSDRTGTRLTGWVSPASVPLRRPSSPMIAGAIELTPSGLIVLGPDHPTTGGYPVVGVVADRSLDALFSRPLGAPVRLRVRS